MEDMEGEAVLFQLVKHAGLDAVDSEGATDEAAPSEKPITDESLPGQ